MTESANHNVPPDWNRYRTYLRLLAGAGLALKLRTRVDPSDLVQQTMLQAHQALPSFRGSTEGELMAWLKQILARNIAKAERDHTREKRDIDRERSIIEAVESSSIRLVDSLQVDVPSPSDAMMRAERMLELCKAMEKLPVAQRMAIELHHWQGMTVAQVASEMGRTPVAVAGLLKRGLRKMRDALNYTARQ